MSEFLLIKGALITLPDRVVRGDLLAEDGAIAQIGPSLSHASARIIEADGRWLLPGAIDSLARVPLRDATAIEAATALALSRGVTTILFDDQGSRPHDRESLRARLDMLAGHSAVHFGVYMGVDAEDPTAGAGVDRTPGVRVALGWRAEPDRFDAAFLDKLFLAGSAPIVVDGVVAADRAVRASLYEGGNDPNEHARRLLPDGALATMRMWVSLARRHGRALHLPTITTAEEVALIASLQAPEVSASVPATHLFLRASAIGKMGVRAVEDPPLRQESDQAALWAGLRDGTLCAVRSGHTTIPLTQKSVSYPHTPPGLPTMGAWLPLILDRVEGGAAALTEVARWTATNPAKQAGLVRRGRIEIGLEADLVLIDPTRDLSLTAPGEGGLDWSPFAGFTLRGRPDWTILRGVPVWHDGEGALMAARGRELSFVRKHHQREAR